MIRARPPVILYPLSLFSAPFRISHIWLSLPPIFPWTTYLDFDSTLQYLGSTRLNVTLTLSITLPPIGLDAAS
jgi:hypothetical protein